MVRCTMRRLGGVAIKAPVSAIVMAACRVGPRHTFIPATRCRRIVYNVLITGAHGTVGTALRHQLAENAAYAFSYTDRHANDTVDTHVADMGDYEALRPAFEGQDAVVHLGWDTTLNYRSTDVRWTSELSENLVGTVNVFQAALAAGLEKVIFASSVHVAGMIELANRPEIYEADHGICAEPSDLQPDSMYAVAKAFGEALGRFCTAYHGLRCYCLRLGGVLPVGYDHPYGSAELAVEHGNVERGSQAYRQRADHMKAMWLSHRDLAELVDCCLRDDAVQFGIYYGLSDNATRWFPLEPARNDLEYRPNDDGTSWDGPPA